MNLEIIQYKLNQSIFEQYLQNNSPPTLFLVPEEFLRDQNDLSKVSCFGNVYDKYLFNHWMFFRNLFPKRCDYCPVSVKSFVDILFGITDTEELDALSEKYDLYLRDYQNINELIQNSGSEVSLYYNEKISYIISLYYEYCREIFHFIDPSKNEILKSALCTVFDKIQKYRQSLFFILISCIKYTLIFIDM